MHIKLTLLFQTIAGAATRINILPTSASINRYSIRFLFPAIQKQTRNSHQLNIVTCISLRLRSGQAKEAYLVLKAKNSGIEGERKGKQFIIDYLLLIIGIEYFGFLI